MPPEQPVVHPLERLSENLQTITRLEQAAGAYRSSAERLADWVARSITTTRFLAGSAGFLVLWIVLNAGVVRGLAPFDPYPFSMLGGLVSVIGVAIAALVLIQQNRSNYLSDRRAHLDLQVNLLAAAEITRTLRLLHRLAEHFGIHHEDLSKIGDLASGIEVEELVAEIDRRLPRDEEG